MLWRGLLSEISQNEPQENASIQSGCDVVLLTMCCCHQHQPCRSFMRKSLAPCPFCGLPGSGGRACSASVGSLRLAPTLRTLAGRADKYSCLINW